MKRHVNQKSRMMVLITLILIVAVFAAGCNTAKGGDTSNGEGDAVSNNKKPAPDMQPVTLNILNQRPEVSNNWDTLLAGPLQKKYPYITVKEIKSNLADAIAAGIPIDLYITPEVDMGDYIQKDLAEDIEPLMKMNGMKIDQIEPTTIQTVRNHSAAKKLFALPFYLQFTALYYNKDIFDKFAAPYPKDGMTWDDAIQLAKKVSGTLGGGDHIYGLKPDQVQRWADPFGITPVDPATNKASVNNAKYRRVFDLSKQLFSIPGNTPKTAQEVNASVLDLFIKDQKLAMYFGVNRFPFLQSSDVNWDMVQSPYFPDLPNIGGIVDSFVIGMSKTSKHKDAAFKVVETLLSDEVQLYSARSLGYVSPLVNPQMKEQFGADMAMLKGKHVEAIFKSKIVPHDAYSLYRNEAHKILFEEHGQFIMGEQDVNTALRKAEERINQKMSDLVH